MIVLILNSFCCFDSVWLDVLFASLLLLHSPCSSVYMDEVMDVPHSVVVYHVLVSYKSYNTWEYNHILSRSTSPALPHLIRSLYLFSLEIP